MEENLLVHLSCVSSYSHCGNQGFSEAKCLSSPPTPHPVEHWGDQTPGKEQPVYPGEQDPEEGAPPSSISLPTSCLHGHHDLVQGFPGEVGYRGLFAGVPHREKHQQLFIGRAVQKHPQSGATVEGSGGNSHQPCVLQGS